MDIERLKEDIRNVEYDLEYGEDQDQGKIAVNVNCLRAVINFANKAIARQSEIEKVVCPDCGGSGVYQEYDDEYDRYHVYACYKCEGTGEIARQSVKNEEVAEAIEQVEGTRRKAQKELDSLIETKSRYDHQIEIGDPWNWKWEESWHPLAVEGHKQTIKNANLAIAALQAYQPWIPVSERLPKNSEHDWVLAQITEDNGYMWIPKVVEYRERIGDWYCEELGWLKTHNGTFKVTHWMPLPEPPKGE